MWLPFTSVLQAQKFSAFIRLKKKKIIDLQEGFEPRTRHTMVSSLPTDLTTPKLRPRLPASDDDSGFSVANVNVNVGNVDVDSVANVTKSKKFSSFSVDSLLFKKESKKLSVSGKPVASPEKSGSETGSGFRSFSPKRFKSKIGTGEAHDDDSDQDLGNTILMT